MDSNSNCANAFDNISEKSRVYAYPVLIIAQSSCNLSEIKNIVNDMKCLNDVLDDQHRDQLVSILLELISKLAELYDEKGNILLDANDKSWEFALDYSFNRQSKIEIHFLCPISKDEKEKYIDYQKIEDAFPSDYEIWSDIISKDIYSDKKYLKTTIKFII